MSAALVYHHAMTILSLGRRKAVAEAAAQAVRAAEENGTPERIAFHRAVLAEVTRRVEQSASR